MSRFDLATSQLKALLLCPLCNCIHGKLSSEYRCPTCHLPTIAKNLKKNLMYDILVDSLKEIMRLSSTRETKPDPAEAQDVCKMATSVVEHKADIFLTARPRQGNEIDEQVAVKGRLVFEESGEATEQSACDVYRANKALAANTIIEPEMAKESTIPDITTPLRRSVRRKSVTKGDHKQEISGEVSLSSSESPSIIKPQRRHSARIGSRSMGGLADISNAMNIGNGSEKQPLTMVKKEAELTISTPKTRTWRKATGANSVDTSSSKAPTANHETPSRPATVPRTRKRKAITDTDGAQMKHLADQWICVKCTSANMATRNVCQMCKELRDKGSVAEEVESEAVSETGRQPGNKAKRTRRAREGSVERYPQSKNQSVEVKKEVIEKVDGRAGVSVGNYQCNAENEREDQIVVASQAEEVQGDYEDEEVQPMPSDVQTPLKRPRPGVRGLASENAGKSSSSIAAPKTIHLIYTGLKDHHKKILEDCMTRIIDTNLTIHIYDTTNAMEDDVTHVITAVDADGLCTRTLKYLYGVLAGKWIVKYEWIVDSIKAKRWLNERFYEVQGDQMYRLSGAPQRGREMASRNQGRLFEDLKFYFRGDFSSPTTSKLDLQRLVQFGGGKLLTRRPLKTLALTPEKQAAIEIDRSLPIIVCDPACKIEDKANSWMKDFQVRDTTWVLNCVSGFKI
ncbi:hypothetical protein BC937DRAFT_88803 [Endogone sp. FLAS-F59071]|nr:hypothetical protein BC937DRAFT_88803 [Endogone sp. FLAS-F59071]|eukprot:RUS18404.1 hypothetical protein BC937DRAFT_88803 [Endogone sp. FLAS-F59071]